MHPLVRGRSIDAPETSILRARIIKEKLFLKKFYENCYTSIARSIANITNGPVLELGSGGGFLKQFIPGLITSDIIQLPELSVVLDGQCLPFKNGSLRGIVMLDVFHHLPRVQSFLGEAARSVKTGGALVMIEPWYSRWSRLVYKYLHHESLDPETPEWDFPQGGPLSQANSALPWIVFDRDRKKFEARHPEWQIKEITLHSPFCYLLSGGVSYRSLMPGELFGVWRRIETIMQPWMNSWAMFAKVELTRIGEH
jgi:SAM-dependent methyltransferase